ncbi:hypothetical protein OESDEN_14242 [Oesophagostomum dentatum]|uniref:Uncharacterized protein n=1 Tax=Oesophagostomum dentatum TaxID=61180 RepID=A0A0B1SS29_OESDE|nr:hypothetical protein OESDEN_14242 [Oesophagostomum dentatum]
MEIIWRTFEEKVNDVRILRRSFKIIEDLEIYDEKSRSSTKPSKKRYVIRTLYKKKDRSKSEQYGPQKAVVSERSAAGSGTDAGTVQLERDSHLNQEEIAALRTAISHTPRPETRARRRSASRSATRIQIPQPCELITPLFIRSYQSARIEPDTDEIVITTYIVLYSYGLTIEERRVELENLVKVRRPAVVNVKTLDDDGFEEERTTQNVLIGKRMIVIERKSTLLRNEQDSNMSTNDVRRYDCICKAKMGPSATSSEKSAEGILSILAENGTSMEGDTYHKTERIILNIGSASLSSDKGKKLL